VVSVNSSSLGRSLETILTATLKQAAELRPLLDEHGVAVLDGLVAGVESDACRIAVVGQVKAGKSSLINALIRRPEFLPTDVNPWTAVVTSLHFGTMHEAGAVYQFFDEEDWDRLAAGGRLLELSQRLGVTLDADTLSDQVRLMRESAQRRLGREFRKLLGQQHRFASPSADVLARYVCVGELNDAEEIRPGHAVGRFADITRSADLYFEQPPFATPTIIIDTPGTNDPFLVRDQLSREALDRTDACVVVLNAQQALSSSDVGLLRLLRGLQKDRLVVFINRVDLLPDPQAQGRVVMEHVRNKLATEYPGHDIPVIIGSALWAEQALAADSAATTDLARTSGVDQLTEALSHLMERGPALRRLHGAQHAMIEIIASVDLAAREEINLVNQRIVDMRDNVAATLEQRERAAVSLKKLEALSVNVSDLIQAGLAELSQIKEASIARLDESLRGLVVRDAAAAYDQLLGKPFIRQEHAWQHDTANLRRELEDQFQAIYGEAARQLQKSEKTTNARVLDGVRHLLPNDAVFGRHLPVKLIDPTPSIAALGWHVALELDDQWQAWWRLWHGQKQRARKLEELVINEFRPLVDSLVENAKAELDDYLTEVTNRLSRFSEELGALLRRRKSDLTAHRRGLETDKSIVQAQSYLRRREELEDCVGHCSRIATELEYLSRRIAAIENPSADSNQLPRHAQLSS
jgi:signal recognition particle receptor subunit beta